MSENLDVVYSFLETVGVTRDNEDVERESIDFERATRFLSPDFVIVNPIFHPQHGAIPHVGGSTDGALSGPEGWIEDIKASAPYFAFSVSDFALYDAGEVILLRANIQVRGVRTGQVVKTPFTELFFVRDGLIRRIEPYLNVSALRAVL